MEHFALVDTLVTMRGAGLCELEETGEQSQWQVSGTQSGHERVQHLLELSATMETEALADAGEESVAELTQLLRHIMENTNPVA